MDNKYKVISMSFSTEDKDTLYGVLRNANLLRQYWPGWHLRVYTDPGRHSDLHQRIMKALVQLGVRITHVDPEIQRRLPASMWRYMVVDDVAVDYFFVRDATSRLLERDYVVIGEFLQSGEGFHCVRDHPDHGSMTLTDGLWGADRKKLRRILNGTMTSLILDWMKNQALRGKNTTKSTAIHPQNVAFMRHLWMNVRAHALCHDSVSCERWPRSKPFPCRRQASEYIGCQYTAYGEKKDKQFVFGKKYCVLPDTLRTC